MISLVVYNRAFPPWTYFNILPNNFTNSLVEEPENMPNKVTNVKKLSKGGVRR